MHHKMVNKKEKDKDLEEYRELVGSAAKNKSNIPIPNSTEAHAKILYETMIPQAKNFINILTGEFRETFYKEESIKKRFQKAICKGVEINILTKNRNKRLIGEMKRLYPKMKISFVNTDFENHFMVIDDKIYRFEDVHKEKEHNVEAIANFNDPARAKMLRQLFKEISKKTEVQLENGDKNDGRTSRDNK